MNTKGLYAKGKRHSQGGIDVIVDGVKPIEVEVGEYKLCSSAMRSKKIYTFKNKTNKEILDSLFSAEGCEFDPKEAESGDYIICRLVVNDTTKKTIIGKVQEIVDELQAEKQCVVSKDFKIVCEQCDWNWNYSEGGNDTYICHKCGHDNSKFENGGVVSNNLEKEHQQKKANELRDVLLEEGFFVSNPNTSITNFGVSTYIGFYDKYNVYRKFRISDHSVTNTDRIFNEYHYSQNTDVKRLVDIVKKDIEETRLKVEKRKELYDLDKERTNLANAKWEQIKDNFKGLTFKKNDRTYQNLDEFTKDKPHRTNVFQKHIGKNKIGENAFYYEWTEPINSNELANLKPSREYIEQYSIDSDNYEQGGEVSLEDKLTYGGEIGLSNFNDVDFLYKNNLKRFEIDDSTIVVNKELLNEILSNKNNKKYVTKLSEILTFWEGYKHYPKAPEIELQFLMSNDKYIASFVNLDKPTININLYEIKRQKELFEIHIKKGGKKRTNYGGKNGVNATTFPTTLVQYKLIHELQHYIQIIEGIETSDSSAIGCLKIWAERESFKGNLLDFKRLKINAIGDDEFNEKIYKIHTSLDFEKEAYDSEERMFLTKQERKEKMKKGGEIKQELEKGIEVEKEHQETINKIASGEVAPKDAPEAIAKDHIAEDKNYYDKLEEVENKEPIVNSDNVLELAINDIIKNHPTRKFGNLDFVEGKILYDIKDTDKIEIVTDYFDNPNTVKDGVYKTLEEFGYIENDYHDGFNGWYITLSPLGIEFKQAVDNRIFTLQNKDVDMFPEDIVISELQEGYDDIKSCLLEEADNDEQIYLFEGKTITNLDSTNKENWRVLKFYKYGVELEHIAKSKLTTKKKNEKISFEDLKKMFKEDDIQIDGITTFEQLNMAIKLVVKCIDMIDTQREVKKEKAKHDKTKNVLLKKEMEEDEKSKTPDLSKFVDIVRNSNSFEEAYKKAKEVKGISPEVSTYFFNTYNKNKILSAEESFLKFWTEQKAILEQEKVDAEIMNEQFEETPDLKIKESVTETSVDNTEINEAIELLNDLLSDAKGKAKKEILEAINLLKDLL